MKFKITRDDEHLTTSIKLPAFSRFGFKNEKKYEATDCLFTDTEDSRKPLKSQIKTLEFLIENAEGILASIYQFIFEEREALEEVYGDFDTERQEGFPLLSRPEEVVQYINFSTAYIYPSSRDNYYLGFFGNATWDSEHGVGIVLHNFKVVDFGDCDTTNTFDDEDYTIRSVAEVFSLANLQERKERLSKLSQTIEEAEIAPCLEAFQYLIDKRAIYGYRYHEVDLSATEKAAYVKSLTILDLSKSGLSEVPSIIRQFTSLEYLNLKLNKLSTLPDCFAEIRSLKTLQLSFNQLAELPASLAKLVHLKELEISDNKFTAFPPALQQMTSLTSIDLADNQIKLIPAWIADLQKLEALHLADNAIDELPKSLNDIPTLEYIDVEDNKFTNQQKEEIEEWLDERITLDLTFY